MKTLYYMFDNVELPSIMDEDYSIIFVNAFLPLKEIENTIDMSLIDYWNQQVKIIFTSREEQFQPLVSQLAQKYDVELISYSTPDIIEWMHKVVYKEEFYDIE